MHKLQIHTHVLKLSKFKKIISSAETSNINEEMKGFIIDSKQKKPLCYSASNKIYPIVFKEKIIRNKNIRLLEKDLQPEISHIQLIEETNEILAIANSKVYVYQIEDNLSTSLKRNVDFAID